MTTAELTKLLIEQDVVGQTGKRLNPKIAAYYDRLLLRIHNIPSLLAFLADAAAVPDEAENAVRIQLDFLKLPDEFLPQLPQVLAAPTAAKYFRYVKDGQARFGVEVKVSPDDFPGDAYNYAM